MKKILLIDDDDFFHHIFHVIFRNEYIIDSATSSEKFYEYIFNVRYDLIVVDIFLNKRDVGKVLIQEMRKLSAFDKTPIICCSALTSHIKMRETLNAGADYFLAKPVESSKLRSIVEFLIENGRDVEALKKFELAHDYRERLSS